MTSKRKLSTLGLLGAASLIAAADSSSSSDAADLQTLYQGRIPFIVQTYPVLGGEQQLSGWVNNITATGQWPDVNYTTGCPAQRANWPAQNHWLHTIPLAAAYTDNLPHTVNITEKSPYDFIGNATVETVLNEAMDYWFTNDFTNDDCIDKGGLTNATCVCGTPGLWNTNWYSNVILIPRQAIQTVLLLHNTTTDTQRSTAVHMVERGATTFGRWVNGLGFITGANTLDISSNLVNAGIVQALAGNATGYDLIQGAFDRVHNEVVVQNAVKADGIRYDGSFGQHVGILYNANYGKDYANLVLSLEIPAAGTQWAANSTSQTAFSKHIDGSAWMVYRNTKTEVEHWDFSTVGRFISFAVSDLQATAALNINLTQVLQLGQQWNDANMTRVATSLLKNGTSVNAGNLVGNRMFWDNDYMVQRGSNYVSTVKMISPRTSNTECVNSQNPFGFHLGQGTQFTYVSGNEYEDIAAAWDWNLIPGITTDYGATPLLCNFTQWSGNRTFVGGASYADKQIGVAAMDYLNPYTGAFAYKKAWFFLPDGVEHVVVSDIVKTSNASDVFHVLDQKRVDGAVWVDGKTGGTALSTGTAKTLWHAGVGYDFSHINSSVASVRFATPQREGNWKTIGTSAAPTTNVTLFQAWLDHEPTALSSPVAYTVYPGTASYQTFAAKNKPLTSVVVEGVSAVVDAAKSTFMGVFWEAGKKVDVVLGIGKKVSVTTSQPAIVIVDLKKWEVVVADPTQTLAEVDVTVKVSAGVGSVKCGGVLLGRKVRVRLPDGPAAGQSVKVSLC